MRIAPGSSAPIGALIAVVLLGSCNSRQAAPPSAQQADDRGGAASVPPAQTPPVIAPQPQSKPTVKPPAPLTPARGYAGPLPPLPRTTFPPPRPVPVVEAVYAFAARHPEVLRHVPCFCGCESHGHVGNDDCFVARRDADGRPTWDAHGIG